MFSGAEYSHLANSPGGFLTLVALNVLIGLRRLIVKPVSSTGAICGTDFRSCQFLSEMLVLFTFLPAIFISLFILIKCVQKHS